MESALATFKTRLEDSQWQILIIISFLMFAVILIITRNPMLCMVNSNLGQKDLPWVRRCSVFKSNISNSF